MPCENVSIALRARGVDPREADDRAEAALGRFGIADLGDRQVEELSGGQMQRVACARGFVVGAGILLADEPTSELDEGNRGVVLAELREEAERGSVVVVATHDPAVVDACDLHFALDEGRLVRGMTRALRGAWSRRGALLTLLAMTAVVVGGAVAVLSFAEAAGTSRWLMSPLLLLGAVAIPSIGRELAMARREEIGLARLRGIRGLRLGVVLLAEPLVTIVLGTALGFGLGWLVARLAGDAWLDAGVAEPGSTAVYVALGTALGSLVIVLLGSWATVTEPLSVQVASRTRPRTGDDAGALRERAACWSVPRWRPTAVARPSPATPMCWCCSARPWSGWPWARSRSGCCGSSLAAPPGRRRRPVCPASWPPAGCRAPKTWCCRCASWLPRPSSACWP